MAVRPGNADKSRLKTPVLFFFAAAAFYCILAYAKGGFSRIDGIILLCIFAVYMFISVKGMKTQDAPAPAQNTENTAAEGKPVKDILMLVVGAALIAVGARLLVDNGTKIAESLGVSVDNVKYHTKQNYKKLGVSTKTEMVLAAKELKLL